ncbi:hypothetical protein LJC24_01610 [Desulfococcaceae bacterium OttesenSCG-928-F15]|nr:hypothetical protein [Desulfococcaceae bacterium OttesenSCG-928-F15]
MFKPNLVNPHHQRILNLILQKRPDLNEIYHLNFDNFSGIIYSIPAVRKLVKEDYNLVDDFMSYMHRFFDTKPSLHPIRQKRNYYFLLGTKESHKLTDAQTNEILSYIQNMLKYDMAWTELDPYYPGYRYLNRKVWEKFLKPIASSAFIAPGLKLLLSAIATIVYELQYVDRVDEMQLDLPVIPVSKTDHGLTAELITIADRVLTLCPHSV